MRMIHFQSAFYFHEFHHLSKIILSSASLRVTLTIPPPALTAEMPAGQYNGYSVTKTDSSIIVGSSL